MKKIELKKATVELGTDGIIHIAIYQGADIQLNDAVGIVEAMGKVGARKKYPVLIEAGEFSSVDKEVRIFSASEEGNVFTLADAIVYASFAQKLIADFYVKHNKPIVPTKVFSDRATALKWLKDFKTKKKNN
jgi:hypothetical protein